MALIAIVISVLLLILVQRFTHHLLYAILASVAVLVIFRFDLQALGMSLIEPFLDASFFKLVITLFLIYFFSHALDYSGDARSFTKSSQALFDEATAMAFMPGLIGFLPMPGGAMFTAPMIKMLGENQKKSADYMMVTNYWFRHTVEFFWPVYPAMFLLVSLTGENLSRFSIKLFPVFLAAFISGWFLLNGFRLPKIKRTALKDLKGLWLVGFIAFTGILILGFKIEGYLALLLNIGGYTIIRWRYFFRSLKGAFTKWDVFLLLFLFYVYKNYLIHVEYPALLAADFHAMNLGVEWLTALLPLILGVATGITQSAVGIATPLLISMGADSSWLYFWSVVGVLLSPIHLCVVLTSNYFQADIGKLFLKIIPMIAIAGFILWLV